MKLTNKFNALHEVKGGKEDSQVMGIVENLKKSKWSKGNKKQMEACDQMMKLAEMDDEEANDFMEFMDDKSSEYDKKEEPKDKEDDKKDDKEIDEDFRASAKELIKAFAMWKKDAPANFDHITKKLEPLLGSMGAIKSAK